MDINSDTEVLRLVWHPAHFQDEVLVGSAFDRADLLPKNDNSGSPRYLSVDEREGISRSSVDWNIDWQQRDGRAEKFDRNDAKFVRFLVRDLKACTDTDGKVPFEVTHEPVVAGIYGTKFNRNPENLAHCGIRNVSGKRGSRGEMRNYVDELRTQLLKAHIGIHAHGEIFPRYCDKPSLIRRAMLNLRSLWSRQNKPR